MHVASGLTMSTSFPNKCRHCDPAPCLSTCPTGAIHRPSDFPDIVDINPNKCIACGMCAMVCPFDVITYHRSAAAPGHNTVAIKCNHCIERQRAGDIPACVEACKVDALVFGEINELAQAARTRFSEAVSAAVGRVDSEIMQLPSPITGLRTWGEAVTRLNEDGRKGA
jgi:carbon-monoxide dehydrogenase iron sulfur subunit